MVQAYRNVDKKASLPRGLKKPRNFCIFAEFNFAVRGFEIIEIRDLRRFFTEKRPIQKYSRN